MTDPLPSSKQAVPQDVKVLENRLRRLAARRGAHLTKVRRHDRQALDYGLWTLSPTHPSSKIPDRSGLSLSEVESILNGDNS